MERTNNAARAISSDPPYKDGNARFTTVPLKLIKHEENFDVFIDLKEFVMTIPKCLPAGKMRKF